MATAKTYKLPSVDSFDFQPGRILARKYEVISKLGGGWEGEVYMVRELKTDIERAAKFFFPQRNIGDRAANFYARKLHRLRHCPIVIQYHTQEMIKYRGIPISFLVSDFVEGELLSEFLARQPGKRLPPFPAMHLLHALAAGIECIHQMREYHGDLHTDNIIIQRYGLGFDLKLLDMFHWGAPRPENIHEDVMDLVRIFYDALGGKKHYARQPQQVKAICRGLKRSLILKNFRTAGQLKEYLENLTW
jgi:serine/threonine protein kinase